MKSYIPIFLILTAIVFWAMSCDDDEDDLDTTPVSSEVADEGPGQVIPVQLEEYSIEPSQNWGPPGEITFAVRNSGDLSHQFIVISTSLLAEELPVEGDQVNLESDDLEVVWAVEEVGTDEEPNISTNLPEGHYVFICNFPDHYQLGMRYDFIVRGE